MSNNSSEVPSEPSEDPAVSSAETREFDASQAAGLDDIQWAAGSSDQGSGGSGSSWFDDLAKAGSGDVSSDSVGGANSGDTVEVIPDVGPDGLVVPPGTLSDPGLAGDADGMEGAAPDSGEVLDNPGEDGPDRLSVELAQALSERDQYLDTSRRLQADMENYRKQVARREADALERANERLVLQLLPVLDACDGAVASGAADVEPVRSVLVDVLHKQGLEQVGSQGEPFDPSNHEAVVHEPDDDVDGQVVAEVLRVGYLWKGRVIRPAMVKVKG